MNLPEPAGRIATTPRVGRGRTEFRRMVLMVRSLGLIVGGVLLVVGSGVSAVHAQQTASIDLTEYQFSNNKLTATVGQPVTWTFNNKGNNNHDFRIQIGS